jgi:hypothetical protein
MVASYHEKGELPEGQSAPINDKVLKSFLDQGSAGDYVAIQAYIPPTAQSDGSLSSLREKVSELTGLATTVGYGPRFLHSTGQLHKGDGGNGLFIQIVSTPEEDIAIPDNAGREVSSMNFGVLKIAQALGDAQALKDARRRVITFNVPGNGVSAIQELVESLD